MDSSKLNGGRVSPNTTLSPLNQFLTDSHARLLNDHRGSVADYIPELKNANPHYFGISLATIDGHVYEVGDSAVPFTIQSISKPFVFALALQTLGAEKVEAVIGVEPSGDTFNSIRLRADNRPHNPMVNAGAIACSALLHKSRGNEAFACILDALSRFAGHKLSVDGLLPSVRLAIAIGQLLICCATTPSSRATLAPSWTCISANARCW